MGDLTIDVVRKEIKHLHVGVYPPHGRVRVAAPMRLDDEAVRLAVVSRLGWIRRKQKEFERQARQSRREMVSGESHYYQGRRYRLDVIETDESPSITVRGRERIEMRVRPGTAARAAEVALYHWYRQQLCDQVGPLLEKWESRIGVTVAEVRFKRMKTLWGSCNPLARRVWLNLELAKKPPACLEYVLVHEMVHILEPRHDDRFRERMNELLPNWGRHRDELNCAPLAHETWAF